MIQIAEHAHFAELGHTSEEGKTYLGVLRLQDRVKGFQLATVDILQGMVANGLQHGLVVLIDQDDHLLPRLFEGFVNDMQETFLGGAIFELVAVEFLPLFQVPVQLLFERRLVLVFTAIEVNMQDGMLIPFVFKIADSQSLEELFLALEIGFDSGEQQTFPEAART